MKNKDKPSSDSKRGSYGSLSRPGRTAAALIEKPALSLNAEFLMEAVGDASSTEPAFLMLLTLRT